jgi:hypothetical protein
MLAVKIDDENRQSFSSSPLTGLKIRIKLTK